MLRLFCSTSQIKNNQIVLDEKAQVHHLRDVLRMKAGEAVILVDEKGNLYSCRIEKIADEISLGIKEKRLSLQQEGKIKITVACAIPKKVKMDDIIDKLTQLGAERIIPLETERVIVKLDKRKKLDKLRRWKKIALSAAMQSQRNTIPLIEPITEVKNLLGRADKFALKLIPTLIGQRGSLKNIFKRIKAGNVLVLIGPEGDFTFKELKLAVKAGCIPVSLGDTVLRVDTAAIAVVSFIRLYIT